MIKERQRQRGITDSPAPKGQLRSKHAGDGKPYSAHDPAGAGHRSKSAMTGSSNRSAVDCFRTRAQRARNVRAITEFFSSYCAVQLHVQESQYAHDRPTKSATWYA